MKLLHTADWHLGKRLHGIDRLDEARAVLAELAELAAAERVDAVLVAGDLLDRRLIEPQVLAACLQTAENVQCCPQLSQVIDLMWKVVHVPTGEVERTEPKSSVAGSP